jgi:hypothetical protein
MQASETCHEKPVKENLLGAHMRRQLIKKLSNGNLAVCSQVRSADEQFVYILKTLYS